MKRDELAARRQLLAAEAGLQRRRLELELLLLRQHGIDSVGRYRSALPVLAAAALAALDIGRLLRRPAAADSGAPRAERPLQVLAALAWALWRARRWWRTLRRTRPPA